MRRAGESIATYVAELRSLSEYCNFGATLNDMLRDRLVCGVNDSAIQKTLLAQVALTYEKAAEIALNAEAATQSMRELGLRSESGSFSRPTPQVVHKTEASGATMGTSQGSPTCYRCGFRGHTADKCRVNRELVCHQCSKRAHLRRACKSKSKTGQFKQRNKPKTVSRLEQEDEGEEEDVESGKERPQEATLYQIKSRGVTDAPPITVKVKLDDCLVDMEVDTGASISLMSESAFPKLWPGRSLDPSPVRLQTYLKEPIPVVGCCNVNLQYKGQSCECPLVIVRGSGPTLLGRDWLVQIQLDWREIHLVHTASLQAVLSTYPGVFQEGLGTLKGLRLKSMLSLTHHLDSFLHAQSPMP